MPPRIIISVTNDLSTDQRVHRVAMTLHEAGWHVLLVGRRLPHTPPLPERPYKTARMRLLFTRGKFFYLEYNLRLLLFLLFRPAHTLLSNDLDTLLPNWITARLRRRRLAFDTHEYWTEVPELVNRPRTRAAWLWLEQRLFPRVDHAMTVNQSIADIYHRAYRIPVAAVRNLPLRLPAVPERTQPGHLLIYQGALNVGRGIELMIAALLELPAHYTLCIAGTGPEAPQLAALITELGLQDRVDLRGHVPFAQLPALTATAALGFSLEEDRGASYHYALPNKLFDYIQAGIPVVVSDLPEMAAIVREHGVGETLPAQARTPHALAQIIRSICENDTRWHTYRQAALTAAQTLCWEQEKTKVLAWLQD